MKLLLCIRCNEVFNLSHTYKECEGGHGGGQYVDQLNAKIWGDPNLIFPLGFANSSLIDAIRNQRDGGDLPADFYYAGKLTPKGREFSAFIIPDAAASIERLTDRFDPII